MTKELEYAINYHARAKRIRIKVNALGNVGVVAPKGASSVEIAYFVKKNARWIEKTLAKLKDDRLNHIDLGLKPPQNITLTALSKKLLVNYSSSSDRRSLQETDSQLIVMANSDDERVALLRQWLQQKAKQRLVPWLHEVSSQHKIKFNKVTIRGQKTRWGSCSNKKNINLNRHLLFLAPELVNYLMVHELSHILQPNHSPKFWKQVASCEPNYQLLDKALNKSHKLIPLWASAG